jgi:hypothetical protein
MQRLDAKNPNNPEDSSSAGYQEETNLTGHNKSRRKDVRR